MEMIYTYIYLRGVTPLRRVWNSDGKEDLTVGRNLFPSTPILKKYSAAEASLGTYKRRKKGNFTIISYLSVGK